MNHVLPFTPANSTPEDCRFASHTKYKPCLWPHSWDLGLHAQGHQVRGGAAQWMHAEMDVICSQHTLYSANDN